MGILCARTADLMNLLQEPFFFFYNVKLADLCLLNPTAT